MLKAMSFLVALGIAWPAAQAQQSDAGEATDEHAAAIADTEPGSKRSASA